MSDNKETRYPLTGAAGAVTLDYTANVNLAMVQNRQSAIISCVLHNDGAEAWRDVVFSISGEAISDSRCRIDSVAPGASVDIAKELEIIPDPDEMIRLTEARQTVFKARLEADGKELLSIELPLRLMPYDQWLGLTERPEMIASFVMPNHPMLSRVIADASSLLRQWTGDGSMNEYQSGDPNRARQQVAALYETLRRLGIAYVSVPASFEQTGQRVRTVDKVLTERLGNCLDLTLLMASCIEAVGLQPIIIFVEGHAFVGAWLAPTVGEMVGDDASFLLKAAADGISEAVLVESTMLTHADAGGSFEAAVEAGTVKLKNDEKFICYVSVAECRFNGIAPIAMRMLDGDRWVAVYDAEARTQTGKDMRRVDRYDLSEFDVESAQVTKYTLWERKLLDFTLRNNLLNMKLGRRVLPLLSFNIDKLEDCLQQGKGFKILPFPLDELPKPADLIYDSSLFPHLETLVNEQMAAGNIFSFLRETDLKEALKYAYRASRTSLEENGASNLYLALGALKWYETDKTSQARYAPLLLVPIEIIRKGAGGGYVIRTRDEETMLNITLSEMLKQQHQVDLSALNDLPKDESGVDVKKIFAVIRDKIRDKKGWNVIEEAMIGLFSFNKFVMWNDIHSNSAKMHANPIISSLVDGKLNLPVDESAEADAAEIDREHRPEEFTIPIDVDSSQLEAVIDSGAGRSFILHGPPGTGKSQTITNIIANALYQGRRVLFVAEKMAALSVVQARLEKIGLGPFCLELHSNKVTKQHFLGQMEQALNVARNAASADYSRRSDELFALRSQLMGYVDALHHRYSTGLSLYDCIERSLAIPGTAIPVDSDAAAQLSSADIEEVAQRLRKLDTVFRVTARPGSNPLTGLTILDCNREAEAMLQGNIRSCAGMLQYIPNPELLALCLDYNKVQTLYNAAYAGVTARNNRMALAGRLGQGIFSQVLDRACREWQEASSQWFLPRFFSQRSILSRLGVKKQDMEYLLSMQAEFRKADYDYQLQQSALSRYFGNDLDAAANTLSACLKMAELLGQIQQAARIEVAPEMLGEALQRWSSPLCDMRSWYLWCVEKVWLDQHGLNAAAEAAATGKMTGEQAANAAVKGIYQAVARIIITGDDRLRLFNGLMFDEVVESYRRITAQFQELSKRELFCRLASSIPAMAMAAHDSSEVGILKRNIKNGGRGTSIRRLIDQIPTLLPRLCPCMLMSPLSVAQYIDLDGEKFDLVIFDEASQMPTSEAVGAIARGKALIVVGDPKQMPPTSFFATSAVGEEEASIDDMESILDDCLAVSIPSRYLTWHYRSKHESLIAFSNSQYYEGRLLTFPSVDDQQRKVTLRPIEGVYQRSGARVNLPEAQAVVDEVLRRLADPVLSRRSIGIVSFSKVQQDKIEDLLTDALASRPDLERIAYESAEPIFIKNLENVQGDERDVILFSVGYGPDSTGKVSMNFGPLNNAGGERRLNVAVSRARYEMIVFSSLRSEQIDMRRSNALGVEGLKKFLEYAEKGYTSVSAETMAAEHTDSIARGIADALRDRGYEAKVGVGRSKFKIDVAVVDPRDPDRYILGIMLDGPAYCATKTVRDREIVQPSVLKALRWNVMRVWSLDWLDRQDSTIDRIVEVIKKAESQPIDAEPQPAPAPKPVEATFASAPEPAPEMTMAASPAKPYPEQAKIRAPRPVSSVDELASHDQAVLNQLREIVAAEQPVTDSLLYKRIVRLWGLTRVSPRLQAYVDALLRQSGLYPEPNRGNGRVWWTSAADAHAFEGYRAPSERDIQEVPFIEIENAMRFVIDQQIAISRDDLKRLTANQLGYTRKGSNIDTATDTALASLVNDGYVTLNGDKVSRR